MRFISSSATMRTISPPPSAKEGLLLTYVSNKPSPNNKLGLMPKVGANFERYFQMYLSDFPIVIRILLLLLKNAGVVRRHHRMRELEQSYAQCHPY